MNIWGLLIYGIIVLVCYLYANFKDKKKYKKSLKQGGKQLLEKIPFLIGLFFFISLLDVFIPKSLIVSLIGKGKGISSILLSGALGSIIQGPVASSYPLGKLLLDKGATLTSVSIFLNSWVMVGIVVLPFEISIFGKKFSFWRNFLSFIGAIIIGILTNIMLMVIR